MYKSKRVCLYKLMIKDQNKYSFYNIGTGIKVNLYRNFVVFVLFIPLIYRLAWIMWKILCSWKTVCLLQKCITHYISSKLTPSIKVTHFYHTVSVNFSSTLSCSQTINRSVLLLLPWINKKEPSNNYFYYWDYDR